MILGLSTAAFTVVHVVLSLLAIASGFVVVFGLLTARRLPFFTALFLATAALTSLTGFLFPFHGMTLSIEMGIPAITVLLLAAIDRYTGIFSGIWRHTYVLCVMIALYCLVVVLVAQLFDRFLPPTARAPWHPGWLLTLAQLVVFAAFAAVTRLA
ncbi:MAG: hypothetical protein P4K94_08655, partial [Terracidiphilus sp.]|nr:hypothetical protein [Terracidiphilus sp.]